MNGSLDPYINTFLAILIVSGSILETVACVVFKFYTHQGYTAPLNLDHHLGHQVLFLRHAVTKWPDVVDVETCI